MAARNFELSDFLRRARGRVDPFRVDLPHDGRVRRVPGLRREEVAFLAGISSDYYARLEQGRPITPTPEVLAAIAGALCLDATEVAHLGHLLGVAVAPQRTRTPLAGRVRPRFHQFLDELDGHPALVLGMRSEVLASNRLARALFADFDGMPAVSRNYARWILLSREARCLFRDWDVQARAAVESLRLAHGAHPEDRALRELVSLLGEQSPEFRTWWAGHAVHQRTYGRKHLDHRVVGELTVDYETFLMPGDPDQTLYLFSTEPASASRDAITLLARWTEPAPDLHV